MGLFGPAWKTKSERKLDKAYAAVDEAEKSQLFAIATSAPLLKVCLHACERLGGDDDLHHRDERCRCVWCHRQLHHDFLQGKILRVGDACRYCGAKVKTIDISRNPFTDELTGSIIVEYADGTEGYMEY